jgi:pimeloyl-ACP methyl ester carboxylesterase
VVPRLAERFDVLAPTIGGHTGGPPLPEGDSIDIVVDGIEAMLDEAGWETANIAGFSLGGWLGFELAKRGRAETVTAISPGGATTERQEREARRIKYVFASAYFAANAIAPLTPELCLRPRFRHLAMRDQMVHGERLTPQEALTLISGFAQTPVFWRFWREIGTPPGLQDLERVDVPVTVLWGDRDRVLPARLHAPFFRDRLPEATFRTLTAAGHVPFWDATDAVVDAISAYARIPA